MDDFIVFGNMFYEYLVNLEKVLIITQNSTPVVNHKFTKINLKIV
jgi:hypothetical protein